MDKFSSYDLNTDHKLRYFYPEADLTSLLGRVQKFLDVNEDLFIVDFVTRGYYDEETENQVWEATLIYFGEVDNG